VVCCGAVSALPLATTGLDLNKLVLFHQTPFPRRWSMGAGDKRAGVKGTELGTIVLRHGGGYEVVLQLDDGSIDTFHPMSLFPAEKHE